MSDLPPLDFVKKVGHDGEHLPMRMHSKEQTAEAQLEKVLDVLAGVVQQACWVPKEGILDSMALSYYADGIRTLAKHGQVIIEHEYGRRVIARWIEPETEE
jgi:hypothetical protein